MNRIIRIASSTVDTLRCWVKSFRTWLDRSVRKALGALTIGIAFMVAGIWFMHGQHFALMLLITFSGYLLAIFGMLTKLEWLKTPVSALALFMTMGWYWYALPSLFWPHEHVVLVQEQKGGGSDIYPVFVERIPSGKRRAGKPDCWLDQKTSTLTCKVVVLPAGGQVTR